VRAGRSEIAREICTGRGAVVPSVTPDLPRLEVYLSDGRLELFGGAFANALELAATGVAGRTGIKDMLLAREMIRQWPAGGLLSRLGWRRARWRLGAAENLEIFKHQLELIEAFGRGAEAVTQLFVQPRAELRNHQIAQARIGCVSCDDGVLRGNLRITLGDDRLERFNIIRQI
jgi:hypothetical protein